MSDSLDLKKPPGKRPERRQNTSRRARAEYVRWRSGAAFDTEKGEDESATTGTTGTTKNKNFNHGEHGESQKRFLAFLCASVVNGFQALPFVVPVMANSKSFSVLSVFSVVNPQG
jgi:hypothetical protein